MSCGYLGTLGGATPKREETEFLVVCEWFMNELDTRCEQGRFDIFGVLSHLWMSKTRAVNEMGTNFAGQEFKFILN